MSHKDLPIVRQAQRHEEYNVTAKDAKNAKAIMSPAGEGKGWLVFARKPLTE